MRAILEWCRKFIRLFNERKEHARLWFVARAHGAHAQAWLSAVSFAESSFFPLPVEILYIPMLLARASRWFYYATLTTLSSVAGGIFGYVIGAFLFGVLGEFLVSLYSLEKEMLALQEHYAGGAFLAIFIGAFTPIPYKIFTISAGFFSINFFTFLVASVLGRGIRYYLLGFLFARYEKTLNHLLFKYFNAATFVIVLITLVAFIVAQFF
ncbi:MAG: DedA family protein [Candidatus Paceibacterota bacterium]